MDALSKEAMDFVKNNCMTWCDFQGCSTRECEKKLKTKIMKSGIELITEERQKQIDKHGFTAEHHALNSDKWYSQNQLSKCASYLLHQELLEGAKESLIDLGKSSIANWDKDWFENMMNRSDKERLIIAGALIAAELDRLEYLDNNNTGDRV